MKILIVVATPLEVTGFDLRGNGVDVVFTGFGKLNAYKTVSEALAGKDYDVVINAGTCGGKDVPVGTIVYPTTICQGDAYVAESFAAQTKIIRTSSSLFTSKEILLSSDNFISCVKTEDGSTSLPAAVKRFDLFDMEGYAVALAAETKADSLFFVKIVSDNLNGEIYDWETVAKKLSGKLVAEIESFIRGNFIPDYKASVSE